MRLSGRKIFICSIFICFANAYPQHGFHQKIDTLILAHKFEEAEKLALQEYAKFPTEPEVICALACVYRNMALKSTINVNASAMGIKDGEEGTFTLTDTSQIKELFKEEYYYEPENYLKAESLYYKIISIDKNYHNSYFNLMNDYITMRDFKKYFEVVDLFIDNLKDKEDTPDYLLDRANKLVSENYLDETLQLYQKLIKAFPSRHEPISDIGAIFVKKGKFYDAIESFAKVYQLEPTDAINLNNYIFASIFIEDFETAYNLYFQLAKLAEEKYNYNFDIGLLAYLLNKDFQSYFNINLKIISENTPADSLENNFWYYSSKIFLTITEMNDDEKIEFFEFLLEQFNNAELYRLALVQACIIEKMRPTNFALLVHGSIYDKFNFYEKTIQYLDKISEQKKIDDSIITTYDLLFNYGRINYAAEKYETTISYWLKNYQMKQDDAFINHYLGMSYLELGNIGEAKKYFQVNESMNDKDQMEYINYSIRELNKLDVLK